MPQSFDVIIAGLGAMGSAAAFHLSKRGCKVLGLDRFRPPHALGSSHGESRIIREAYFEHPIYVPLVQRAYELWAELGEISGQRLLLQTGGLMVGPPDGVVVTGARTSAETHKLRHEILTAAEVRKRFPALNPSDEIIAVWEPGAGVLFPELCIQSHLTAAERNGAMLRYNEPVLRWTAEADSVQVNTHGGQYTAKHLIISAGSWVKELISQAPTTVERQVLVWFEPAEPDAFVPERCPIYLGEYARNKFFYGFPNLGNGVKLARHHQGMHVDPNTANREVLPQEIAALQELSGSFLPKLSKRPVNAMVCLYTNMPDEHFMIDWHQEHRRVLVCSPCSGHGFKFSSAVGEVASELILNGRSRFDLSLFKWR